MANKAALLEVLQGMDYDYLLTYAELVWEIEDPEGYKHEDLIAEIVGRA